MHWPGRTRRPGLDLAPGYFFAAAVSPPAEALTLIDLQRWNQGVILGRGLHENVAGLLRAHQREDTLRHIETVALEAASLAARFGADAVRAEAAGWIHDISAVIPASQRLPIARAWGLDIFPEEEAFPMLLHQRLSAILARELMGVEDQEVLEAAACHTTLRAGSSRLDQVVFVADKLAWDQPGHPPYLAGLQAALEASLDRAAWFYLDYLHEHATGPLHPWARQAWRELSPSTHFSDGAAA